MDMRRGLSLGLVVLFVLSITTYTWAKPPDDQVPGGNRRIRVLVKFHTHAEVEVIKDAGGNVHVIIDGGKACSATVPGNSLARLRAHASVEFVEPDVQTTVPHGELGRECGHHDEEPPPEEPPTEDPPPEEPPTEDPPPEEPPTEDPPPPTPSPLPTGINRIDAEASSAASGDGQGTVDVDIAVLDTGIDLDHPDLNVVQNKTWVSGTTTGDDDYGHGSHIAGTCAAKDDGQGHVGVAPGARLWAYKVADQTGSGYLSTLLVGVWEVTNQAASIDVAVICMGFSGASSILDQALTDSVAAGVVYAVAAGNGGGDVGNFAPANHPAVLTVSAIVDTDGLPGGLGAGTVDGADDTLAAFSNRGATIDLAAPGVDIESTWKDGGYAHLTGSSAAAPFVGGTAALYRASNPGATPDQVKQALLNAGFAQDGPNGFGGDTDGVAEPLVNAGAF